MNDAELSQLLKSAGIPEPGAGHWEAFPGRVTTALRATRKPPTEQIRWRPKLAWGLSFAGACLLIGFAVGHWRGAHTIEKLNLVQSKKLIGEVRALFPNQVQAVIFDGNGVRLVLAEKADVPDSPPIYLNICGPEGCRQFITFSGQQIHVDGEACDVLADAEGNIILAGKHFVWTSESHVASAGVYRIEARSMEMAS